MGNVKIKCRELRYLYRDHSEEYRKNVFYRSEPITITHVVDKLNEIAQDKEIKYFYIRALKR